MFYNKEMGDGDDDAVKLVVLFFIEWFVLSGTKSKNVPQSILDIIDSGLYNEFPWGCRSFEVIISSLKGKMDSWVIILLGSQRNWGRNPVYTIH